MRRTLDNDPTTPAWPEGIDVRSFHSQDAPAVHALLEHAFRGGGGSVDPFETWLPPMTSDAEFDPELWFLAEAKGVLVFAEVIKAGVVVAEMASQVLELLL